MDLGNEFGKQMNYKYAVGWGGKVRIIIIIYKLKGMLTAKIEIQEQDFSLITRRELVLIYIIFHL